MNKRTARFEARRAIDLLEEAVRVLRSAPAAVLLFHALGAAPCWLGALYFFTDMSRSATAGSHVVGASLLLAALYVWMKCWQAVSAAYLRAALLQEAAPTWDRGRVARLIAAQALLQPLGLVIRFWAALILLPYVWVATFFQNVTVLGDGRMLTLRELCIAAWNEAKRWPKQAHGVATLLTIFGFFVYLNFGALISAVPMLMKTLLGIETVFSRHPDGLTNPTVFLAVFALTYLCVDPIRKAAVALRCFYGGSLESGEDLAVALKRLRAARRLAPLTAVFLLFVGAPASISAQEVPPRIEPARLNQSIDEVLDRREFAWRAPREGVGKKPDRELSWIEKAHRDFKAWSQKMLWKAGRGMGDFFRNVKEWIFGKSGETSKSERGFDWVGSLRFIVWGLIALGAVLLAIYFARRRSLRFARPVEAEALSATPDLRSPEVTADQLPEDGWLQLARDLRQSGELRLALRASFLASLAHLGHRELIRLARHKSDRDYDRELRRRARAQTSLLSAFAANLTAFERAWYGSHEVTAESLGEFSENLERIRSC